MDYHDAVADAMVEGAKRYIDAQIAALEKRLEAKTLKYVGVWQAGRDYRLGECATHGGSLWHCNTATKNRPGDGADWTMCVKSSR